MTDQRLPGVNNLGAPKKPRGFAALTPERRAEIASQGGIAAHRSGRAHQFTSEEAKAAGKLGGMRAKKNRMAQETAPPEVPVQK
jgi:general stress protein YciG